jgi:hypothetical protein
MFQQEALWISFSTTNEVAIKVSIGGKLHLEFTYYALVMLNECRSSEVNTISGAAKDGPAPPSVNQDYVVAGLQPWLDGIMTESDIVWQVDSKSHILSLSR